MDCLWLNIKEKGSEISAQSIFTQDYLKKKYFWTEYFDSIFVHLTSYQQIALLHFKSNTPGKFEWDFKN